MASDATDPLPHSANRSCDGYVRRSVAESLVKRFSLLPAIRDEINVWNRALWLPKLLGICNKCNQDRETCRGPFGRSRSSSVRRWSVQCSHERDVFAVLDAVESCRTVADILGKSENRLRLHYGGRSDVGKRRALDALDL